ncbi:MAG TPA: ABC transporter permease [Anaerolineales bacterium]
MLLAYRNLAQDKTRLLLSTGGVALAILLILVLNGFLSGINQQITSYLDRTPGSILVAQRGVNNLLGATSLLPPGAAGQVASVDGVERVIPILSQFVILELDGKKLPAFLVGYQPDQGGGPWQMASGRSPQSDDELVFDQVLAQRHGIRLGSSMEILGEKFTVVGLSQNTTSWMASFFFLRKTAAERLLRAPGATSFLLVSLKPGAATQNVRQRLAELPGLDAWMKTTVAANDLKLFAKVFSIPLKLMVAIAFLVGTLVVGLVIYTATVERQREYGALKAIGARNWMLYRVVAYQALSTSLAGAVGGVLLSSLAARWIMAARPQFLVVITPYDALRVVAAGLAMALAAALVPARWIAGLAPADVFRK